MGEAVHHSYVNTMAFSIGDLSICKVQYGRTARRNRYRETTVLLVVCTLEYKFFVGELLVLLNEYVYIYILPPPKE